MNIKNLDHGIQEISTKNYCLLVNYTKVIGYYNYQNGIVYTCTRPHVAATTPNGQKHLDKWLDNLSYKGIRPTPYMEFNQLINNL